MTCETSSGVLPSVIMFMESHCGSFMWQHESLFFFPHSVTRLVHQTHSGMVRGLSCVLVCCLISSHLFIRQSLGTKNRHGLSSTLLWSPWFSQFGVILCVIFFPCPMRFPICLHVLVSSASLLCDRQPRHHFHLFDWLHLCLAIRAQISYKFMALARIKLPTDIGLKGKICICR